MHFGNARVNARVSVVVFCLCAISFLSGHLLFSNGPGSESSSNRKLLNMEEDVKAPEARKLISQPRSDTSESQHAMRSPSNPLDPAELEQWMVESSGLMKVRPPLTPSQSGDSFYHAIPFQILSWRPRLVVYPAFVDSDRCDHIVELAKKYLYPSGLAFAPGEKVDVNQQTRTSKGTFLSAEMDPDGAIAWVEERIAAVTLLPRENGEPFNVLKYENGQHYDSHMDSFDPKTFGPQPSQRIVTVVVYLTDVEEGGETVFKREGLGGESRPIDDWRNCDDGVGLKYKPRKGDAVLFWDVLPDGKLDPQSLHGGCPVKNGTKYAMAKWIRNKGSNAVNWA